MMRSKSKIPFLVLMFCFNVVFSQKVIYDFDRNGKFDYIKLNAEIFEIKINLNGDTSSLEIPEITGYEKVKLLQFNLQIITIHYYSSHVSMIDLFIRLKDKKWMLTNILGYFPCQTCKDQSKKTYERAVEIELKKNQEFDVSSILSDEKIYENII